MQFKLHNICCSGAAVELFFFILGVSCYTRNVPAEGRCQRQDHCMMCSERKMEYYIHTNISTWCRSSSRWISPHSIHCVWHIGWQEIVDLLYSERTFFMCINCLLLTRTERSIRRPSEHRLWIKAAWIILGPSLHWPFQGAVLCSGLCLREHVPVVSEQPGHTPLFSPSTLLIDWPGDILLWRSQQKTPRITNDPCIFHFHLPVFWHLSWKNKDEIWFYT